MEKQTKLLIHGLIPCGISMEIIWINDTHVFIDQNKYSIRWIDETSYPRSFLPWAMILNCSCHGSANINNQSLTSCHGRANRVINRWLEDMWN